MNNFVFGDARASCKGLAPKGGYAEVPRVCPAVLFKAQRSLNRTAGDEPTLFPSFREVKVLTYVCSPDEFPIGCSTIGLIVFGPWEYVAFLDMSSRQ